MKISDPHYMCVTCVAKTHTHTHTHTHSHTHIHTYTHSIKLSVRHRPNNPRHFICQSAKLLVLLVEPRRRSTVFEAKKNIFSVKCKNVQLNPVKSARRWYKQRFNGKNSLGIFEHFFISYI